ncbi:hypothetical protein ACIOHC_36130 [Streptomyces sp. NPDC088252]|uniref:hypothetical protein n=1 Tax=Streptomyces sp. NPDC088252 TaxID=3365845 RepID=UPI003802F9C8
MKVELLQTAGRTLEITPAEGIRTSAPVLPRGEILVLGGAAYVVVALRQELFCWGELTEGDAVTTYLVDEAVDDGEGQLVGAPEDPEFVELMSQVWPEQPGEAA